MRSPRISLPVLIGIGLVVALGVARAGEIRERAAAGLGEGMPAREAALARRLCAQKGMKIGSDGVQLLGGHGFVKEHPVERWYRDLRAAGIIEGGLLV